MARRPRPIARIRLARSWPRLLAVPAGLLLLGTAVAVAALLVIEGPLGYAVAALGAIPALAGIVLGLRTVTMQADVEEAAVRLHWLGGSRMYALVPGPVTRVRLRGDQASALRSRTGILGWQFGSARLREEEQIEIVRLAPTRTAILVPTDRGRLAIAAASEPELLDALSRAARARKRLEDLAAEEPRSSDAEADMADGAAQVTAAAEAGGDREPPPLAIETPPHVLTGIERAMLDEQLARKRVEMEAAELAQAETEAAAPAEVGGEPALVVAEAEPEREDVTAADAGEPAQREPVAAPGRGPAPSIALVLLPLLATVALWGAALALERLPASDSDTGRLTALALVLAGPATSIGAIMARAWWPRLVGVVVTGGLAAAVFIGRALFGA
jgi:hypothetical protein